MKLSTLSALALVTCVTGCGLNPYVRERAFANDAAIGDTIQSDAACKAQKLRIRFCLNGIAQPQHHFLDDMLDGACNVHFLSG